MRPQAIDRVSASPRGPPPEIGLGRNTDEIGEKFSKAFLITPATAAVVAAEISFHREFISEVDFTKRHRISLCGAG